MTTRIVETEQSRDMLLRFIEAQKLPFTASITEGKHRSTLQNKLQRKWVSEIAEQMPGSFESAEHVRGHCKLHYGVPILREDNEAFRVKYDRILKPLAYEEKIQLMMEPISLPVTSIMNTKQKKRYLDEIWRAFSEQGVILTDPEQQGRMDA